MTWGDDEGRAGGILDLAVADRVEYRCRLRGGGGRVALHLDGRKLLDHELGEVSFTLPPLVSGQHALGITLFRQALAVHGASEIWVNDAERHRLEHDPAEEGFLGNHTIFLNVA
jgi:hypothetical protein